jgi:transcriptional regulator with XRE-family HTH domain
VPTAQAFFMPAPIVVSGDVGLKDADMQKHQARKALKALGARVKERRLKKGWNRTTLARKAHVTVTTIRGLEDGTKVTQASRLRVVAAALGASLRELEADDTADPRVRHWSDDDYVIGAWYHHATIALKSRLWALQESTAPVGAALLDPDFLPLLEGWTLLDQEQKNFMLNSCRMFLQTKRSPDTGGADVVAPADAKTRGPHR